MNEGIKKVTHNKPHKRWNMTTKYDNKNVIYSQVIFERKASRTKKAGKFKKTDKSLRIKTISNSMDFYNCLRFGF